MKRVEALHLLIAVETFDRLKVAIDRAYIRLRVLSPVSHYKKS